MNINDGKVRLNLGSGNEYRKGWINIDVDPRWEPDILCNIEEGIPLEDNSVDFVFTKHVLEHIHPEKFAFVMGELKRVCRNGAKIVIYCPYFSCSITYKTFDHLMPITYYTFDSFPGLEVSSKKLYFFRSSFGYENKIITKVTKILNPLLSLLPNWFPLVYERFFCWTFPVEEIKVVLNAKK
jgi:SAM-dependent methyltransferase